MKAKDKDSGLTAHELRSLLDYNPETGIFRHKFTPPYQGKIKAGDIAGYVREGKYLVISVNSKKYYAHRLAWLYAYGAWPERLVDHRDENKLNNSLNNLQLATMSQNKAKRRKPANNTSGFKGVTRSKGRWRAQITFQGQVMYLGHFKSREEAHSAYLKKARELFGEFAHP